MKIELWTDEQKSKISEIKSSMRRLSDPYRHEELSDAREIAMHIEELCNILLGEEAEESGYF